MDDDLIENQLEQLYMAQDRPLNREKRAYILGEIKNYNFPLKSILKGIKALKEESVSTLKLGVIVQSIRRHTQGKERKTCGECFSGVMVTKDQEGRYMSNKCGCVL